MCFLFPGKFRKHVVCYISNKAKANLYLTKSNTNDAILAPLDETNKGQKFVVRTDNIDGGYQISLKIINFMTHYALTSCGCAFVVFAFLEKFLEISRKCHRKTKKIERKKFYKLCQKCFFLTSSDGNILVVSEQIQCTSIL